MIIRNLPKHPGQFMKEFLSRNFGLVSEETQKKIKKTRILLIGCGLGSQIAILAARKGFTRFILCDGDKVELNNLNRQAFDIHDLGINKAKATRKRMLRINPHCKIEIIQKFVKDSKVAKELVRKSDVIINMADPEEIMYFINDEARRQNKPVIFPFTFGFGGLALVFLPKSATIEDIIGGRILGDECFAKLIINSIKKLPGSFKDKLGSMEIYQESLKNKGFVPQIGISSNITASIVVGAIIRLLEGNPVPSTPNPIFINPWE